MPIADKYRLENQVQKFNTFIRKNDKFPALKLYLNIPSHLLEIFDE